MSGKCECVTCASCDGSGFYWLTMGGCTLGRGERADMDEQEACAECRGRGISEMCESCAESEWREADEQPK